MTVIARCLALVRSLWKAATGALGRVAERHELLLVERTRCPRCGRLVDAMEHWISWHGQIWHLEHLAQARGWRIEVPETVDQPSVSRVADTTLTSTTVQ